MSALGLDLGAGGESDEGVSMAKAHELAEVEERADGTDVRVMERRPPPAPARAWAMLSPC